MGTSNTFLTLFLLATFVVATPKPATLPVVDLGYELHRALSHDPIRDSYKFSNIRYAQPPTGNLRFRAPVPPLTNRDQIQTGDEVRACPQGIPLWQARAVKPTAEYSNGKEFSLGSWEADIKNYTPATGKPPPPTTEDCLFLDVHVPRQVFDDAKRGKSCNTPVLVWVSHDFPSFNVSANDRADPWWRLCPEFQERLANSGLRTHRSSPTSQIP